MNHQQYSPRSPRRYRQRAYSSVLSALVLICVLLLLACSSSQLAHAMSVSSPGSTPATSGLDPALVQAARTAASAQAAPGVAVPGMGFLPNTNAPAAPANKPYINLPTSVDLSAYNAPVRDQGIINSCSSWVTGYYLRGWYARRDGYLNDQGLSPMYLYSQLSNGDRTTETTFTQNLDILKTQGIDTAADYAQGGSDYAALPTAAEQTNAARFKLTSYTDLTNDGSYLGHQPNNANAQAAFMEAVETSLASGNPLVLGIATFASFDNAMADSAYIQPGKMGDITGLHAVFAYGYDQQGLYIENQWGTIWGNNGYAELSWAYVMKAGLEVASIAPQSLQLGWQRLPGAVTDLSVGADGSVWAIGTNAVGGGYGIYRWDPARWAWDTMPGGAVHIAVDPSGAPWVVNDIGAIFHWNSAMQTWQQMPGAAEAIAVSDTNDVWMISRPFDQRLPLGSVSSATSLAGEAAETARPSLSAPIQSCAIVAARCNVYKWTGTTWQSVPATASAIAVAAAGIAWIASPPSGNISRWTGSAWKALPGLARTISLTDIRTLDDSTAVWVIGADAGLYRWNWQSARWDAFLSPSDILPGSGLRPEILAVGPAESLWVADSSGAVFQLPVTTLP